MLVDWLICLDKVVVYVKGKIVGIRIVGLKVNEGLVYKRVYK